MKRGYEQENLYTITKHAEEFKNKVRVSIDNEEEKYAFFKALRSYHETGNLKNFINDIKSVINTPKRYPLFKDVRYLINPEHVEDYLKMIPNSPSDGIHMVRVQRMGREPMGFSIRGGKEHGVGVFVSLVTRGSPADIVGVKEGDEVLSVNNMILTEATHDEVVNLMKTRRVLLLKVRSTGNVPCKINNMVTWEKVEDKDEVYYHPDLLEHLVQKGTLSDTHRFMLAPGDKQAFLIVGNKGIGCSIRNGIPGKDGLFVISVTQGSLSDKTGIRVGDQIVAINGKGIIGMSYSEAVYLLKTLKEFTLVLRHSKEAEDFVSEEESSNGADKLPEFAVKTQLLLKKAEERQKERREKAKDEMHFETLARVKSEESLLCDEIHEGKQNGVEPGSSLENEEFGASKNNAAPWSHQEIMTSTSQEAASAVFEDNNVSVSMDRDAAPSLPGTKVTSSTMSSLISVEVTSSSSGNGKVPSPPTVTVVPVEHHARPILAYTDMTPNTRKRALFTERIQVIQTPPDVSSPTNKSPPASPGFNPSNCEYGEEILQGRHVTLVTIEKVSDLGIGLEERNDGIFIKEVKYQGSVAETGAIYSGDQLLNVEGTSLIGVSLAQAQKELKQAMSRQSNTLDVVIALSPPQPGQMPQRRPGVIRIHKDQETGHEIYDTWL